MQGVVPTSLSWPRLWHHPNLVSSILSTTSSGAEATKVQIRQIPLRTAQEHRRETPVILLERLPFLSNRKTLPTPGHNQHYISDELSMILENKVVDKRLLHAQLTAKRRPWIHSNLSVMDHVKQLRTTYHVTMMTMGAAKRRDAIREYLLTATDQLMLVPRYPQHDYPFTGLWTNSMDSTSTWQTAVTPERPSQDKTPPQQLALRQRTTRRSIVSWNANRWAGH